MESDSWEEGDIALDAFILEHRWVVEGIHRLLNLLQITAMYAHFTTDSFDDLERVASTVHIYTCELPRSECRFVSPCIVVSDATEVS